MPVEYSRTKIRNTSSQLASIPYLMSGTVTSRFARRSLAPATRDAVVAWRERLYAFRAKGKVSKHALHGFRGSLAELLRLPLEPGTVRYMAQQMMTLKMATRAHANARYRPGSFALLPYELTIKGDPAGP